MNNKSNRKKIVAANWKMNITHANTKSFVKEIAAKTAGFANCETVLCVPYINLVAALEAAVGTTLKIGAQNCHWAEKGAFTGEISPYALKEISTEYVILGHSERRMLFGESDETVNLRLKAALAAGLKILLCVGEKLEERTLNITNQVVEIQLKKAFEGITAQEFEQITIAYEPVWAIGTGQTATATQAEAACKNIRDYIAVLYGEALAQSTRVLYGGSVNGANAAELFAHPNIDGGLIGSAALCAEEFAQIVEAAN